MVNFCLFGACSRTWNELMFLSSCLSWFSIIIYKFLSNDLASLNIYFFRANVKKTLGILHYIRHKKKKIFGPFPSLLFTFLLTCFPAAHYSILSGCFQGWLGCGRMIWSLKQHSSPIKRVVERRTQWGDILFKGEFPFPKVA